MSYGELKIDTITFTAGGVDASVSVSGLVQNPTFTGNITTTGTISGDVIRGNTVSGTTVTGDAGEFGTITGNTAGFATVTGITITGNTGKFSSLSGTVYSGETATYTVTADDQGITITGGSADVNGALTFESNQSSSSNFLGQIFFNWNGTTVGKITGATGSDTVNKDDGSIGFWTSSAGTPAKSFDIESNGNVVFTNSKRVEVDEIRARDGDGLQLYDDNGAGVHVHDGGATEITVSGTEGAPALYFNGDSDTGIYSPGANQVAVATSGVGRLFINASGRVGVNKSSPVRTFEIEDPNARASLTSTTGTNGVFWLITNTGGSLVAGRDDSTGAIYGQGAYASHIRSGGAYPLVLSTDNTPALTIDSSQRVGIGNSLPGAKLDVSGDVSFNGGGVQYPILTANAFTPNAERADLIFSANATSNNALRVGTIASSGGVTLQGTRQSDSSQKVNLVLNPDGGNVGIGNTTPGSYNAGGDDLVVGDNSGNRGITIAGGSTGESGLYFADGSTGGEQYAGLILYDHTTDSLRLWANADERARIDSSGRLLVGFSNAFTDTGNGAYYAKLASVGNTASSTGDGRIALSRGAAASTLSADASIGGLYFSDNTGGGFAAIEVAVDGTPGSGDYPGRLVFATTADSASSPTERMRIGSNGQLSAVVPGNSTLYPGFMARAWVNFDGTSGSIGSGRASGNVSSITDQATGTYTINFTNSMPDANYAAIVTSGFATGTREDLLGFVYTDAPLAMATSSVSVKFVRADTNAAVDTNYGMVAIFR